VPTEHFRPKAAGRDQVMTSKSGNSVLAKERGVFFRVPLELLVEQSRKAAEKTNLLHL